MLLKYMGFFDFFSPAYPVDQNVLATYNSKDEAKRSALIKKQKAKISNVMVVRKRSDIVYTALDFDKLSETQQRAVLLSMSDKYPVEDIKKQVGIYDDKLFKPMSIFFNIKGENLHFNTVIKGEEKDPEEVNVLFTNGGVLIKGPASEVYSISSAEKFNQRYTRINEISYRPASGNMLLAVRITKELLSKIKNSKMFKKTDKNRAAVILTSYGGTHILKEKDVVIIDGDNFYRVQKDVFKITYEEVDVNTF